MSRGMFQSKKPEKMACQNKGLLIKCKVNRLQNDPKDAVNESLRGMAMVHSGLFVLDGFDAILRRDYKQIIDKVKIISGGGSGNEPTHSGFVGPGMLTAAVYGNVNSAPTIDCIFQVIKELGTNHIAGILLIVQNYPGYVLNFTLAKIRAEKTGIFIKMLIIDEEAILPNSISKPRGLLGTLFVHKIAGAMAEDGRCLKDIFESCSKIIKEDITSIGINTYIPTTCTSETGCKQMEIGYGIHGESGKRQIEFTSCHEIVSVLLKLLLESKESFSKNNEIAVMINNLGGCSQLEGNILTMEVVQQLSNFGLKVLRLYNGYLMTSFNNSGFHISLLNISHSFILDYLDAKTSAPSWPRVFRTQKEGFNSIGDFSNIVRAGEYAKREENEFDDTTLVSNLGPKLSENASQAFLTILIFACDALIACSDQLDIIDQDGGDGDCGMSLASGAKVIKEAAENNRLRTSHPAVTLHQISLIIQKKMHGMQGGLYSIFFDTAAQVFASSSETNEITACLWLEALSKSNRAIAETTGTKEGDRTMLDSLLAAEQTFACSLKASFSPIQAFGQAVKAAEEKAIHTTFMNAKVGRASLMEKNKFERPDAGAHAVGIWMRAIYEGVKLKFTNHQ